MATVSIPFTFVNNAGNADATQVNLNFTTLSSFINSEVIQRDASVAFTQIPTLPATTPTLANHATRKGYVDSFFPVTSANIADGTIMNGDISATALITLTRLQLITSGAIPIGASDGVITARTLTGDVTVTNTGVTTVGSGTITKTKLATTAGELGAAWTTYTPTMTNISGAQVAAGAYLLVGKTLFFRITLPNGNSSVLAGTVSFSLPASLSAVAFQLVDARQSNNLTFASAIGTSVTVGANISNANWAATTALGTININGVIEVA